MCPVGPDEAMPVRAGKGNMDDSNLSARAGLALDNRIPAYLCFECVLVENLIHSEQSRRTRRKQDI